MPNSELPSLLSLSLTGASAGQNEDQHIPHLPSPQHGRHSVNNAFGTSPSLQASASLASLGGGGLQPVPENEVVVSPPILDSPAHAHALGTHDHAKAAFSPSPYLAARSLSSSFCASDSELSIGSPGFNLTVPAHEMSHGILVALKDRAQEMQQLYDHNAPFFERITSTVLFDASESDEPASAEQDDPELLKSTGGDRADAPSPTDDASLRPPRPQNLRRRHSSTVQRFLETLFMPREQLPDRPWMDAVEAFFSHAPANVKETFRELVGYESEDDYDEATSFDNEFNSVWLPEQEDEDYEVLEEEFATTTGMTTSGDEDMNDRVDLDDPSSERDRDSAVVTTDSSFSAKHPSSFGSNPVATAQVS